MVDSTITEDIDANSVDKKPSNFLRQIIDKDLASGKTSQVVTRFPPEPNGHLHIGHAKSICLNFGLAEYYKGKCHLRFDDTNPEKESAEFVKAISDDISWLGFSWDGDIRYSSNYFDQLHAYANHLIANGDAYVCDLSAEQARAYRGTLTSPGTDSPYRDRSPAENADLFAKMTAGEFDEGACALRAKVDMASPNINMRDPVIYRIRKVTHHQTGDKWCVYPTYDFTHGQSDSIEGVSHSICTLEFEDHKPLYNWFLAHLPVPAQPCQYEFSRLNVNYTITSKRKLKRLVDDGVVVGWDDPRMPTISGMRRRGYAPESIRSFCEATGVTRVNGVVDMAMLEFSVREHHNIHAPRAMVVINPLKVVITNYPDDQIESLTAANHPQDESMGTRVLPFTKTFYIDKDDFREEANKKFKRLVIGKKVRLRNAYVVLAESVVKDAQGEITEVHVSYDAGSLGVDPADGVKPKGVVQWVSATEGKRITVRDYDRLFSAAEPEKVGDDTDGGDFMSAVNADSLTVIDNAIAEPALLNAQAEQVFQFEREGYFVADRYQFSADAPIFNKTIGLRDSWPKQEQGS